MNSTPFGNYVRTERVAAKRSLRQTAEAINVSHVYLGQVERGTAGPLREEHWSALINFIPSISEEKLRELSTQSRPLSISLNRATPEYRELGFALARRIENQDLAPNELAKLLELLGVKRDE